MGKSFILGFLKGLKFPFKLLKGWLRKRKKKSELERKCYRHVRLNTPSNVSYQVRAGKKLTERQKEWKRRKKRKFPVKKTNNSK